jgi:ribonuclease D
MKRLCRPLRAELVRYARTDVHYLLHIADALRAELAARGPHALREAERRSHELSLNLYAKPTSEVRCMNNNKHI